MPFFSLMQLLASARAILEHRKEKLEKKNMNENFLKLE